MLDPKPHQTINLKIRLQDIPTKRDYRMVITETITEHPSASVIHPSGETLLGKDGISCAPVH